MTALEDQYERLHEVCFAYGLPVDVDALVEHLVGNQRLTGAMEAHNADAEALQHVGWMVVDDDQFIDLDEERNYRHCYAELQPVFTHDRWLTKVPNTERNKR